MRGWFGTTVGKAVGSVRGDLVLVGAMKSSAAPSMIMMAVFLMFLEVSEYA